MRLPWKSQRPRVRIKSARDVKPVIGGSVYEIQPESYDGPWYLPKGTVLEVVYMPKEDRNDKPPAQKPGPPLPPDGPKGRYGGPNEFRGN
jgi:hypothetical protein